MARYTPNWTPASVSVLLLHSCTIFLTGSLSLGGFIAPLSYFTSLFGYANATERFECKIYLSFTSSSAISCQSTVKIQCNHKIRFEVIRLLMSSLRAPTNDAAIGNYSSHDVNR